MRVHREGISAAPQGPNCGLALSIFAGTEDRAVLDKFLYGRPRHRLLQDLSQGLNLSPGTLAGGVQALAPLFEPRDQALVRMLRREPHWHAAETRWAVFVDRADTVGQRW